MPTSVHSFGACDTDTEASSLPGTSFRAALNVHLDNGQVRPATGNITVPYTLATGTTACIGRLEDTANGTAIEFLYNTLGNHRLVRYDLAGNNGAGSRTTLLQWAGLKLSPTLTIRENLNGFVIDGLLSYRDSEGEVRCLSLARAAAGLYTADYLAAEPFALHLLKVPPHRVITWARATETAGVAGESLRVIQGKAYQFAYRYRYVDGEVTVLSPWSEWCDILTDPSAVTFNVLVLTLPNNMPAGVQEVEIVTRQPDEVAWTIVDTVRRNDAGTLPATYRFYGQLFGATLTDAEGSRPFESLWPCRTGPTLARSRPHVADLLEGYPTPTPAFTATAVDANADSFPAQLYALGVEDTQPSDQYPGETQVVTYYFYYYLLSGTYPDPASTYQSATTYQVGGQTRYVQGDGPYTYQQAFQDPKPTVGNETARNVEDKGTQQIDRGAVSASGTTFHQNSPYPVGIQFYDALGRPAGATKPVIVPIPNRPAGDLTRYAIRAELTTTDPAALNAEIPGWAYWYQWVVGDNTRASSFIEGQAADVLGYLGQKSTYNKSTFETYDEANVVPVVGSNAQAHEKSLVDIGNFTAAGLGYVWVPGSGDVLRYRNEKREFLIIGQQGSYLIIADSGYPDQSTDGQGNTRANIEIYTPNTTPSTSLYERGPRLPIVRTGNNRSYSQRVTLLQGDCYLLELKFPVPDRSNTDPEDVNDPDAPSGGTTYFPPLVKAYVQPDAPILVECMVPRYRLAPSYTTTTTVTTGNQRSIGDKFGATVGSALSAAGSALSYNLGGVVAEFKNASSIINDRATADRTTTSQTADTANRTAASLIWLTPSRGGRQTQVVPRQLQQVRRQALERFGGQKQQGGGSINGLSRWEALNQYDKAPQEQGAIVALALADQSQTDGNVLLALQEQGSLSLYLNQQPIAVGGNDVIIAQSNQVIPDDNTLQGGYGCTDPGTVATYDGKVFYYCRRKAETIRYNKGNTRLGTKYQFRTRLQELTRAYASQLVTGFFDPSREEYWLIFHGNGSSLPGATVVWSERYEAWSDGISSQPEAGGGVGNELVTWQGGLLARHLPTAPVGTFFGVYTAPSLTFTIANPGGRLAKTFQAVGVQSSSLWVPTRLTTPSGQASRILPAWARFIQGVWRAAIRRDENSPGTGTVAQKLHNGRELQDVSLTVTLTCPQQKPSPLVGATVDYLVNSGQQPNQ